MLRRAKTKETLLIAGGRWDRLDRKFLDQDPESCKYVDLEESQVPLTRWYAEWLRDFREGKPRDTSLAIAGGDRRGGKTFLGVTLTLATCIDVPLVGVTPIVSWMVSANYQERDELDREIRRILPTHWATYRKAPEFRYTFAHGAMLRNVSADDPETLKRGRVDICFANEGQKLPVLALSNAIYGTVDKGGIVLIAANPPRRQIGEWILSLKEAIDEKKLQGAKFFEFSSRNNTQIQQDSRSRVGGILQFIDPKAAAADDEGAWLPVGDRAYPKFNKKLNVGPTPEVGDITAATLSKRLGRAYDYAGGCDFQGTPHHASAIVKIFQGPNGPIYWFCGEVVTEQGTEDDLIDDILDAGFAPENLFVVGDASGAWQDGKHQFRGRVSFDFFKARRFHIEPPQRPKGPDRSGRSRNPAIEDRLNLVFKLMEQGRLMVDPERCPRLLEAFKECALKSINGKRKPCGRYAHITDAAGYVLYWLEPKPRPALRATPGADGFSFTIKRKGSDYY